MRFLKKREKRTPGNHSGHAETHRRASRCNETTFNISFMRTSPRFNLSYRLERGEKVTRSLA